MDCPDCGAHMQNSVSPLGADEFLFLCPDCGNEETHGKFPEKNYLGEPMTPMADPYGYQTIPDYADNGRH